ncbi:MAG: hypothetical protein PHI97_04750 [Desulfobulbus sp.]|nr:hypothetical protein [Desulfobulbus sp.]
MKIAESTIQLASSHTSVEYSERRESLTVWRQGKNPLSAEQVNGEGDRLKEKGREFAHQAAKVSLSEAAQQAATSAASESSDVQDLGEDEELMDNLNMRILRALFEKLTGRKFRMLNYGALQKGIQASQAAAVPTETNADSQRAGWGVEYRNQEIYHESESSQFSAQGVVTTADGQQIEIGLEVNLSSSFTTGREDILQLGDAKLKDPLVINFDGNAAQLSHDTFSFDIDADGAEDQIAFVGPGSGFLALDSNGDGRINDGSELFGAQSGDGFADLAKFDQDGNGWIDEADSIYSQLRIWTKNESGGDQLLALGDKNIGAIYVGKVATPFSLKSTDNNELQGQVRATGLFLFENGGVGSMQQLDLVA